MLIQITNSCSMGCRHCLQDSKIGEFNMSMDMVDKTISFISKTPAKVINISGGEPTEHPQFFEILKKFCEVFLSKRGYLINIISNGSFIFDEAKTDKLRGFFLKYGNLALQICTHKDYYPKYKEIITRLEDFKKIDSQVALAINPPIYIHQIGRAAEDSFSKEQAKKHRFTTSCLMASTTFWQLPFNVAILNMESRAHFCTPLIDWRGNIHLSESWLCPSIGNVESFEKFMDIVQFKPCGKCADYQKLLNNKTYNYVQVKKLMNIQ